MSSKFIYIFHSLIWGFSAIALCIWAPAILFPGKALLCQIIAFTVFFLGFRMIHHRRITGMFTRLCSILIPDSEVSKNQLFARVPGSIDEFEAAMTLLLSRCHSCSYTQETPSREQKTIDRITRIMLDLSNSVLNIEDPESLYHTILTKAIEVIPAAQHGSLNVLNNKGQMEFKAIFGFDPRLYTVHLDLHDTFLWRATGGNIKDPIIIRNTREQDKEYLDSETYDSLLELKALQIEATLSSPIIIGGELYGMLNIDSENPDAFTEQHLELMKYFSNQAAIVIRNHNLYERTLYLSRFDRLTGTYNRGSFEELFSEFHKKAVRYKEPYTLCVFDLNNLKTVNDTYGHLAGDRMIQHFSETVRNSIRTSDLLARLGGDEFICVFFNTTRAQAEEKLTSISSTMSSHPLWHDGRIIQVRFSFGSAEFPNDSDIYDSLVHIADSRMYQQKVGDRLKKPTF